MTHIAHFTHYITTTTTPKETRHPLLFIKMLSQNQNQLYELFLLESERTFCCLMSTRQDCQMSSSDLMSIKWIFKNSRNDWVGEGWQEQAMTLYDLGPGPAPDTCHYRLTIALQDTMICVAPPDTAYHCHHHGHHKYTNHRRALEYSSMRITEHSSSTNYGLVALGSTNHTTS